MRTTIEELNDLCQAENSCITKAKELREQQLQLCRKEMVGRCFRGNNPRIKRVEGEKYNEYTCFTEAYIENKWEKNFSLKAVLVRFNVINKEQDFGVAIEEQSDCLSEWLDRIEDAEETSSEEFKNALLRAESLIYGMTQKAIGEK